LPDLDILPEGDMHEESYRPNHPEILCYVMGNGDPDLTQLIAKGYF